MRITLDEMDRKLVSALQRDANLTTQAPGELPQLSASQAGRRRRRLESESVISGCRVLIDAARVGLAVQAFVKVALVNHQRFGTEDCLRQWHASLEVVAVWTLTGDTDYLLRVHCTDQQRLNHVLQ